MKTKLLAAFLIVVNAQIYAQSPCTNIGFESSAPGSYAGSINSLAITGWSISSQQVNTCSQTPSWIPGASEISLVQTPLINVSLIGTLPHSPLGGTLIAAMNYSTANWSATRLTRKQAVTSANSLFQFAHAGYYDSGNHLCCEQPKFMVEITDTLGNAITCLSTDFSSCQAGTSFSVTNGVSWNNWQLKSIDLTPLIGTSIIINVISQDCIYGGHTGFTYFDAKCASGSSAFSCNCVQVGSSNAVSYCAGANVAYIQAPSGYQTYSWTAQAGYSISAGQSTLSTLTITNPVVGATYTVWITSGQCQYYVPYTLVYTSVNISGAGVSPACQNNANGSATVVANGGSPTYNYAWYNSNNSVISTGSVASGLTPGNYTVHVSASTGCGTAAITVSVSNAPPQVLVKNKPFCSNQPAYFSLPGATNVQWYFGSTAITGTMGTQSHFTVTNPQNSSVYRAGYTSAQGCRDSVIYTLVLSNPGNFSTSTPLACYGLNTGSAVINLNPVLNGSIGENAFYISSLGSLTPVYSSTIVGTPLTSYTVTGLTGGGTYSAIAFDGSCYYSGTFTVATFPTFDFTLSPNSRTVCSGNSIPAAIHFTTGSPAGYSYLWQPNQFLLNNQATFQNTFITPTVSAGNVSTIVYSVSVIQTSINCPVTRTLAITVANPVTPTIQAIPAVCSGAASFSVNAIPAGGTFSGNNAISPQAVFVPSLASIGNNVLIYTNGAGTCIASTSISFAVVASPSVAIAGNLMVCSPEATTLSASGASGYNWSTGSTGSTAVLTPAASTMVSVTGNNGNCTDSASVQIQVSPKPLVSITGNTILCAGSQATLVANGASGYLWNNGSTASSLVVNPSQTTMYYVTGSNSFCKDSSLIVVNITAVPLIQVSGNFSICPGETALLVATGASSYSWNTGATSGIISVSPVQTTQYIVTGVNAPANCASSRSLTVIVDPCLGLSEMQHSASLVYPNPVTNVLTIEKNKNAVLKVYNELGMIILTDKTEAGTTKINTINWPKGIYFVSLEGDSGTEVFKILKSE